MAFVSTGMSGNAGWIRTLSLAAAFTRRCGRTPREYHLSLNHHCGKLSIGAVYRGLQDDHAPRPTWTGTATPVSRPGSQARKIFVFDSMVVVRNPGETLSP